MSGRLKILISAYACSPYQGSEPGVGWGFVRALAEQHELWVIVEEEKFRADIERYLKDHPQLSQTVHFHFISKQRNRALRKLWPPSYYWYYRRWHQRALLLAQRLHREVGFDLAHQLTMVGFREPGYLWQLDVPFVWGPVGGLGPFPWRFVPQLGAYGAAYYLGYNIYNALQTRFMTRPRQAARRAGVGLLTATPENQRIARKHWDCESTVMVEVGLPREPVLDVCSRKTGEALRIVWTGLHVPRKALNLGLQALAMLARTTEQAWELHVLGEGAKTEEWRAQATRLGLAERCHFHGWLPREQALAVMERAHVMLITSLRDLTSTVTVEAMALGLPIVCLDHCGFAHVVDESCGIKVPVTTPSDVIAGLSAALSQLIADEPWRQQLARGALLRAKSFDWRHKIQALNRIYAARLQEAGTELSATPQESQ